MVEYERKLLLRRFDFQELASSKFGFEQFAILQGYKDDGTRYRRKLIPNKESAGISVEYWETKKADTENPAVRNEEEREIEFDEFERGFNQCESFVDKIRYKIEMDGYELIVDSFHESMATLTLCEIEILRDVPDDKVVDELQKVQLPDFIQRELILDVTEFPEFKNENLAIPLTQANINQLKL